MAHGKTIKIFLLEGDPNGRLSCELSNWTGKAYKIPRTLVPTSTDRQELNNAGVYLLFGQSDNGQEKIYIGEAESVMTRLKDHLAKKEFWYECIIFISKDENLNKAHIKFLETRLYELAVAATRYELDNASVPARTAISESDRAEMEEFLANIRLLVRTLGHKAFEPKRETDNIAAQQNPTVYIKGTRNAQAQGRRTAEGFLVMKGSRASLQTMPSFPSSLIAMRQQMLESGTLQESEGVLEFREDYIFGSPSTAAMVVFGRPSNGLEEWKDARGVSLKRLEAEII